MKKMLLFFILSILGLCMCSCANSERNINLEHPEKQEDKTEEQLEDEIDTDHEVDDFEKNVIDYEVDFFEENEEMTEYTDMNVEYIRITNYNNVVGKLQIIRSREELASFYEIFSDYYGVEIYFPGYLYRDMAFYRHFYPEISKYNAEFFENRSVVVIFMAESSGSISHKLTSYLVGNQNLAVNVNTYVPSIGTCDVASWLICLEVEKYRIENCQNVKINVNTIKYGTD